MMMKMMIRRFTFLLFLLLGMGVAASAYNNTYAIVIAVADYQNFAPDDGDLNYTVDDANSFVRFLKSKKGGSIPASNIVLLTDAQATKANIQAKAKALFAKAQKEDRVIFYFSGHGGKGYFLPYDVTYEGDNLLYFSEMKAIFRTAKCKTKLLFADACFSGGMKESIGKKMALKKDHQKGVKAASDMNIAVMMSCQGDETSLETGALRQGLFTYYLIEGLGGMANSDGNRYVTIQELFYYVYHKVQDAAAKRGHKQTPELFGKFDLRLIVANLQ